MILMSALGFISIVLIYTTNLMNWQFVQSGCLSFKINYSVIKQRLHSKLLKQQSNNNQSWEQNTELSCYTTTPSIDDAGFKTLGDLNVRSRAEMTASAVLK